MITFTSLGGASFRCTGGNKPLVVFPDKAVPDGISLMAQPREDTKENVISWPGEYNMAGVSVRGVGHKEGQQVSYVVEVDGVRCAFLSSPLQDWSDVQLEAVGDVDVLVLPAEDVKLAQKLIDEFDPRVLVLLPMADKDSFGTIAKNVGVKGAAVSEHKLKGSLPAEGREVVVLQK